MIGFCAWVVGVGLNVGITLVAIVLGPVATTFFLFWLLIRLSTCPRSADLMCST